MDKTTGHRVKRIGVVTSDKMEKSIVVIVERKMSHPLYQRTMKKSKKFVAHDEENTAKIGDTVEIAECRPMSKRKHWRLVKVLESVS